ncbi:hypothetical protein [Pseudomonas viridiflava]|uniref:hypothetical protein n=1 Tax=Pseudomonas viridiflava TaxID=33069 RepID=UPI001F121620|nr:hypothetical protein [Pseudomonas viridiflava]
MSKDTKIFIPEIPGEWTERTRSGHTCKWNDGWHGRPHRSGLPYVELIAPEKGLYAERIDGAWYWVSGCAKCTCSDEHYSYVVCDKHDVCVSCNAHRTTLTDTPWAGAMGLSASPAKTVKMLPPRPKPWPSFPPPNTTIRISRVRTSANAHTARP